MSEHFEEKLFRLAAQEQIILPETLENKMDARLKSLTGRRHKKVLNFRRSLLLAAAFIMLFSITAIAATNALQRRMEAMNGEKLEEYFTQIYASRLSADNYNRPYMDSEKKRMKELQISYEEQGCFPEGELTMIDDAKAYKGKNVSFLKTTSTFFFPEKEMNDEQLLQIIDFYAKREYSLQKMNEMIAEGQVEFPDDARPSVPDNVTDTVILQTKAVLSPDQELTIPYTGELSIKSMAAGNDCIFLGGRNAIHQMEIGSSDSTLFYESTDEDAMITALCQDSGGRVFAGLQKKNNDGTFSNFLWVLDGNGNFLEEIDISSYGKDGLITVGGEKSSGYVRCMMADEDYLYLRGIGFQDADFLLVLDKKGNLVSKMVSSSQYYASPICGMCIGKDGKPYTVIRDENSRLGIALINPKEGTLDKIYSEIVPEDTISIDLIAPGYDADFILWGYSGSFSFNFNEKAACQVTPAYELPCPTEGSLYLALPDGRIVFAYCTEYHHYTAPGGEDRHDRIPEKTCFYYLPGLRK